MPQKVLCKNCDNPLYIGELKYPFEIIQDYNNKCPYCGRELNSTPLDILIEVLNTNNRRKE